jgi:hypothetical protein
VSRVACAARVSGTCETAAENRVARWAKRSSAGVRPRADPYDPSRSARSVSIVIRMIGRPGGIASGACMVRLARQAASASAIIATQALRNALLIIEGSLALTSRRLLPKDEDPRKNEMHAGLDFVIFVRVVTS